MAHLNVDLVVRVYIPLRELKRHYKRVHERNFCVFAFFAKTGVIKIHKCMSQKKSFKFW